MGRLCSTVVRCWGTRPTLRLSGYLWVVAMFGVLAVLEANRIGVFLVPPFGATLTILMLLPDAPVAQPYALIAGSVCGAAVGTAISLLGSGLGMAVLAMIAAFVIISLIHAYHPPGVALASIPVLLHPGHWFPLLVVLPFTAIAVASAAAMSRWLRDWPEYPKSLRDCALIAPVASRSEPLTPLQQCKTKRLRIKEKHSSQMRKELCQD